MLIVNVLPPSATRDPGWADCMCPECKRQLKKASLARGNCECCGYEFNPVSQSPTPETNV